jgi:hypothetical protein
MSWGLRGLCTYSSFLTSAHDGGKWSASCPDRSNPGEIAHGTHWMRGWVTPRGGLDAMEKRKILPLSGIEHRCPARSLSLYRLGYSGPYGASDRFYFFFLMSLFAKLPSSVVSRADCLFKCAIRMETAHNKPPPPLTRGSRRWVHVLVVMKSTN